MCENKNSVEARYDKYASEQRREADKYRLFGLIWIMFGAVFFGYLILNGLDTYQITSRFFIAILLFAPGIVCLKESDRHRRFADKYAQMSILFSIIQEILEKMDVDGPKKDSLIEEFLRMAVKDFSIDSGPKKNIVDYIISAFGLLKTGKKEG